MQKPDGWELLKQGHYRAGLKRLKEEIRELGCEDCWDIGLAHMYFAKPEPAKEYFDSIVQKGTSDSSIYAFDGIARWELAEHREACSMWENGLDCDYQDGAGGMELPCLLFYAAVRDPKSYDISKASALVKQALRHPWAENWPGPVGRFLLGMINAKELLKLAQFEHPEVTDEQQNQAEFYIGVKAYQESDSKRFFQAMKKCASAKEFEMFGEFYLARFELRQQQELRTKR
jgi:hypothetical protein